MRRVTLITGGARSGKSDHALRLAAAAKKRLFIATAEPLDEEMRERIAKHRAERGEGYRTVEAPLDPAAAIREMGGAFEVAVLDCLTVWLGNLMHRCEEDQRAHFDEVDRLLALLASPPLDIIVVSNELGMGLVPPHPLSRRFRDLAGRLNQQVAAVAGRVVFMVSGVPLYIKEQ